MSTPPALDPGSVNLQDRFTNGKRTVVPNQQKQKRQLESTTARESIRLKPWLWFTTPSGKDVFWNCKTPVGGTDVKLKIEKHFLLEVFFAF